MELEFDKEMDAILRRGRDDRGVLVGDKPPEKPKHIDADAIAAFVENALPAKTKSVYVAHFADCDRCRRILSQSMLLNSGADERAASLVSAPGIGTVIPWYQNLFRTPSLAFAMGALVLVFGGLLGVIVLQNKNSELGSSVAQVKESERPPGGPFLADESSNAAAASATGNAANTSVNTASNAAMPSANTAPNPMATPGEPAANKPALVGAKPDLMKTAGESPDGALMPRDEDKLAEESRPASKAAPPPPVLGGAIGERENKKEADDAKKSKDSRADSTLMRQQTEAQRGRDMPPSPAKSGPARTGPLNTQSNQIQNQTFDMPVTRSVGGKTFNNRSGAWYDSAYKNQATQNYRRGTVEYKKLDGGLRNIADTLGGTVVVVWKSKAYRIQ